MAPVDLPAFLDAYRVAFGPLRPAQADGLSTLLGFLTADSAMGQIGWCAYLLATVKHECADRWVPVTEYGSVQYFAKYDAGTPLGTQLGNGQPGDGYKYRGRGYVQITGRTNYGRLSDVLALTGTADDLALHPGRALEPRIAYAIATTGMMHGLFTGRRLADYLTPAGYDYRHARRIINGMDRADLIARYAGALEGCLRAGGVA